MRRRSLYSSPPLSLLHFYGGFNMIENFTQGSMKQMYDLCLKATYNMKIGEKTYEPGEVIAYFDKIQIIGLNEIASHISARGGKDNRRLVTWDITKELNLSFTQGVFSPTTFAIFNNARLFEHESNDPIKITQREELESNENKQITLKHTPTRNLYVYDARGNKLSNYTVEGNVITIESEYTDVIVTYDFDYVSKHNTYKIGQKFFSEPFELQGRTSLKDDTTGQIVTVIITIPRLKLMSDLSMTLGDDAHPVTSTFRALGLPVGSGRNAYVAEYTFLDNNIDSDF